MDFPFGKAPLAILILAILSGGALLLATSSQIGVRPPDLVYATFTKEHAVAYAPAVARFETVLAAGQSAAVSIPRAAGEAPARIVLSNASDHLHIAEPAASVSAQ